MRSSDKKKREGFMYYHALRLLTFVVVSIFVDSALLGEKKEGSLAFAVTDQTLQLSAPLRRMALSPLGGKMGVLLDNKAIQLWNTDTQQYFMSLDKQTAFTALVWDKLGKSLITGSDTSTDASTVSLWDAEKGTKKRVLEGHIKEITSLSVSADGTKILTSSYDGTARLWDSYSGKELMLVGDGAHPIECAALSPDGKLCATATHYTVNLWDLRTGQHIGKFKDYSNSVLSLALNAQGRLFIGLTNGDVRCEAVHHFQNTLLLEGHTDGVSSLVCSPHGNIVVTGSSDKTVRVWDSERETELASLQLPAKVVALALNPHDFTLFIGLDNQTIECWKPTICS